MEDKRRRKYGRICHTMNKGELIQIMYKLYKERLDEGRYDDEDNIITNTVKSRISRNIDKSTLLARIKNKSATRGLDVDDDDMVSFYSAWAPYSVNDICPILRSDFEKNGYIFEMSLYT